MTSLQTFIKEQEEKFLEDFTFLGDFGERRLSFFRVTNFKKDEPIELGDQIVKDLQDFRAKERQDLLALIAEEVGKMKEDYWVDFGEIRNAEKDGMNKVVEKVLTLLRSEIKE